MKKYMTKQRKELQQFLENNADKTFSAHDIYEALQDQGVSLSSIYRNLPKLEAEGLINRVVIADSTEAYYQSIHSKTCKKSIHLNCIRCGRSHHLDEEAQKLFLGSVSQESDFEVDLSKTIIYGKCKDCKENKKQ